MTTDSVHIHPAIVLMPSIDWQQCVQLPDPLLLVPVHFSLLMGNSQGFGTFDATRTGQVLGEQLAILNQAFRGRLQGCNGDCVDTRIQFTPQSCMDAALTCVDLDWQVPLRRCRHLHAHGQSESLFIVAFGRCSDCPSGRYHISSELPCVWARIPKRYFK